MMTTQSNSTTTNALDTAIIDVNNVNGYVTINNNYSYSQLQTAVNYEDLIVRGKYFKLGNIKVKVYNDKNYKLACDKIILKLIVDERKTEIEVSKSGLITFSSINDLKDYVNKIKKYYKQTMEYVKTLDLQEDF